MRHLRRKGSDTLRLVIEQDCSDHDLATIIRSLAASRSVVELDLMPAPEPRARHERPDFGGAA